MGVTAAPKAAEQDAAPSWLDGVNERVGSSKFGRLFELRARRTTFTTEICAGITVFLTVAQLIAVNPAIIAASGGPCGVSDCTGPLSGSAKCLNPLQDAGYADCVARTARSLVAVTCFTSVIGCLLMAFLANMPLVLAPGMGINAMFTFSMVGQYGSGPLTYAQALSVGLTAALLMLVVSVLGLRSRVMQLVPKHLVFAMLVGLGLFLAMTGLRSGSGIGLIVGNGSTLVTAGGCAEKYRVRAALLPIHSGNASAALAAGADLPIAAAYGCEGGLMTSPETWLGIAVSLLMVLLMASGVRAAIAWGVLFATAISWIPGHGASYLSGPPGSPGAERMDIFRQVVSLPDPRATSLQLDFAGAFRKPEAWTLLFSLFTVVLLDSTSTAFGLAELINQQLPGFMGPAFTFPRRIGVLSADALACIPAALMGSSPLIIPVESSVAIEEGGRTGLVPLTTAVLFLVAAFFAPLFSQIPPSATGPALFVVGSLMVSNARLIDWRDITSSFPAFVTISLMPLTYSIATALLAGLAASFALWALQTCTALSRSVLARDPVQTPRDVLRERFSALTAAFGDIDWDSYKQEVKSTFKRATTLETVLHHKLGLHGWGGAGGRSDATTAVQVAADEEKADVELASAGGDGHRGGLD